MSAAYAMSLDPEKFEVTVFDKEEEAGGMATSVSSIICYVECAEKTDTNRCLQVWRRLYQRRCSRL